MKYKSLQNEEARDQGIPVRVKWKITIDIEVEVRTDDDDDGRFPLQWICLHECLIPG